MYKVEKGLLFKDGKQVAYKATPNIKGKFTPEFILMHYTAATTAGSSLSWLTDKRSQVSAHLLIDRDGKITQFAPFNVITWHAGRSEWEGETFLNDDAIGIEFVNAGLLVKKGENWICPVDGKPVADHDTLTNIRGIKGEWATYTTEQISAGVGVCDAIRKAYKIKEVLGHEDVSPGRKTDPGPAFPWKEFKISLEGHETTAGVNIREGYSTAFKVLKVLPKGTHVKILNQLNGWTLVEVEDATKLKGWINSNFIQ